MQNRSSPPDQQPPLSQPVFWILISLSSNDLHGYALLQDIERRSAGDVVLSTSTLYGALKRMMRDQLVEPVLDRSDDGSDDERRQYYRITPLGREVAQAEAGRIERLANVVRGRDFLQG